MASVTVVDCGQAYLVAEVDATNKVTGISLVRRDATGHLQATVLDSAGVVIWSKDVYTLDLLPAPLVVTPKNRQPLVTSLQASLAWTP